jgi:tetratricopeptide (TPR) repeat protein
MDPLEPVPTARRAAQRAVEQNPCSIDGRLAMAIVDWRQRSKPVAESVAEFRAILDSAPNSPTVLARMGMLYHELGQMDDAARMFAQAYRLDPLSANTTAFYVWILYTAGNRDEAKMLASTTREQWPWVANLYEVQEFPRLLAEENYDAARRWIREYSTAEGVRPTLLRQTGSLLIEFVDVAESGDESQYEDVLSRLLLAAEDNRMTHNYLFELLAVAGFHDDAMALARERIAGNDFWFRGSLLRPTLKAFRSDPAVFELFEMNGLLEYWHTSGEWPDFCEDPELPYDCRDVVEFSGGQGRNRTTH